jgi:high affinity Mn2+ porin
MAEFKYRPTACGRALLWRGAALQTPPRYRRRTPPAALGLVVLAAMLAVVGEGRATETPGQPATQASSPPATLAQAASAQPPSGSTQPSSAPQPERRFAIHGQATWVEQETNDFHAPYAGPNSLSPSQGREMTSATLYLGARLWQGAEIWLNPEVDEGFGLDDTTGVAGFPSGLSYKVGSNTPYFRLQRAFVRDTFNLGGERTATESAANQLSGELASDRIVLTFGKFSVTDVFDTNRYAHDPTQDFLNWSVIDTGSFDYAADAWGYTVGAAVEWYVSDWTARAGVFDLSDVPNSRTLESGFDEYQIVLEFEHRHELRGHPGKLALTGFESHGRMALLDDAVAYALETGAPVDPTPVRHSRKRNGASLNFEQEITHDLGVFARAGGAGGNVEAYEFTDIDRTAALGLSLAGMRWHRPQDTFGLASVINGISAERRRYLAAGGLGILVGDGQLPHAGNEHILETYYKWVPLSWLQLTLNYQWVRNPGYNSDRGPASIFALRIHAYF